jgi:hypothetical protein
MIERSPGTISTALVGRKLVPAGKMTATLTHGTLMAVTAASVVLAMAVSAYADDDDWRHDWTVLTLASDGAWGVATDDAVNRTIASAINACRAKSKRSSDCGAKFVSIRGGWSIALLCGEQTIITAAKERVHAEHRAAERESELRQVHRRNMPPCAQVVTVNPYGSVVGSPMQAAERK